MNFSLKIVLAFGVLSTILCPIAAALTNKICARSSVQPMPFGWSEGEPSTSMVGAHTILLGKLVRHGNAE